MKKIVASILLAISLASGAFALTWQDAADLIEKNSNSIKSAQKQAESSRWSYHRAFGSFLPQLSANAGASQTDTGSAGATSTSYSYGLSISQSLFAGLQNYYNLQSAYAQSRSDQVNLEKSRSDAYYNARIAFIDLLIAQENLKLQSLILDRRIRNERLIRLNYEGGKEDKGNLMQNEAYLADARHNVSSASRQLRLAKLNLTQLLGSDVATVEGAFDVSVPPSPKYDSLAADSPAYLIAKYQLEQAEISYRACVSGYLPSVSLQGSYKKSGANWPPESESKSMSLNISYSLFPGGTNIADSILYSAKLDKAREDFDQSAKSVRYSIEEAYENFTDAAEALKVKNSYLAAAQERENIASAKYINGLMTYNDWDLIESAYISAQQSQVNAQKSALRAEAAWHNSYGGYIK